MRKKKGYRPPEDIINEYKFEGKNLI